jgi:site-specific recombinase XerD
VSRTASERAGIPVVGGHRLRHTAATELLRSGASLREVGEVLRQSDQMTTSVYAKIDERSLRLAVRPWPAR